MTEPDDDLLDLREQAEKFADKIYDIGSTKSMVFGLDAPWGLGKTSFLNLMRRHWEKNLDGKYKIKPVVFNFEPLKFPQGENLSDRFIEETVHAISKEFPIPELTPLLGRYSRYLRGLSSVTIFGFQFGINDYLFNDGYKLQLENFLQREEVKLIVFIEDLDRISYKEAKQILYSMKSAFDLPNISYVVCYDSQNMLQNMDVKFNQKAEARCSENCVAIASNEAGNTENLLEFLEKFVQIKVPIFIETDELAKYLSALMMRLQERLFLNYKEEFVLELKAVIEVMLGIKNEQYHEKFFDYLGKPDNTYYYEKIIRDPRKIKRLLNHIVFLDIKGVEYVDGTDFLHLLLIYINYPHVFRHIYQVETGTTSGYFARGASDKNEEPTEKDKAYYAFKRGLDPAADFLLEQIFSRDKYKYQDKEDIEKIAAKFPGNLPRYLDMITKQRLPPEESSHKYQLKVIDDIHHGTLTIEGLYQDKEELLGDETKYGLLWLNLSNKIASISKDYSLQDADNLILRLISYFPLHSALEISDINIGIRFELPIRLLSILDAVGWDFKADRGRHNTPENLKILAHRILGLEKFEGQGIIDKLLADQRGILGLYDLMLFRLYISPDRSGGYFNIDRALLTFRESYRETEPFIRTVDVMQEISQTVFSKFAELYIDKEINIFAEIDSLSLDELSGGRTEYIKNSCTVETITSAVESTKTKLKAFISYQLGSTKEDFGIGCGFYDLEGSSHQQGINAVYNDYLFNLIFNPEKSKSAHQYFLDYLLINSGSTVEYNSDKRVLRNDVYKDVLNTTRLAQHIETYKAELIAEIDNLATQDKQIIINQEAVTYRDYKHDIIFFLEENSG
ncbi:P-loop NTPase fold protein [Emcibacter nanhaiensis]|uniref:P-loop NTPase fold protein n=1 Tax=Emcibacter nanhaiensis TaxID=1505037 RepID=UPI002482B0AC|nr:P-loop NTPase fold protein [Emcibacter nanhaiensis]